MAFFYAQRVAMTKVIYKQASTDDLMAALPHMLDAPKDNAAILQMCLRPDYGQRRFVDEITFTSKNGIPGERWATAPWLKLPDGRPDPRIQVSILGVRVRDAVWLDQTATPHPGDPIIADIDCSYDNMPVGQLIGAGSAVLRVSDKFNDACVKWKTRYGTPAKAFITHAAHQPHRLRGLLCEIVQDGTAKVGDKLVKLPSRRVCHVDSEMLSR